MHRDSDSNASWQWLWMVAMKCTPMTVFAVSHVMKNFAHTHNEALQVQNPALALTHGKWDRIIIIFQPGLQGSVAEYKRSPPDSWSLFTSVCNCLLSPSTVYYCLWSRFPGESFWSSAWHCLYLILNAARLLVKVEFKTSGLFNAQSVAGQPEKPKARTQQSCGRNILPQRIRYQLWKVETKLKANVTLILISLIPSILISFNLYRPTNLRARNSLPNVFKWQDFAVKHVGTLKMKFGMFLDEAFQDMNVCSPSTSAGTSLPDSKWCWTQFLHDSLQGGNVNLILQFNSSQLKMEQFATEFEFELRCRINHMSLNVIGCHMNMKLKLTCPLPSTKLHAHFSIHCNL